MCHSWTPEQVEREILREMFAIFMKQYKEMIDNLPTLDESNPTEKPWNHQ